MQLIVITPESPVAGEPAILTAMLRQGADHVHLRHPSIPAQEMRRILRQMPPSMIPRVHIHDCFGLVGEFPDIGVHLNGRNPIEPKGHRGMLSRSCHSVAETAIGRYDYVTLSPVFPSISKPGYRGHFTDDELQGLMPGKVVALGGVTCERIGVVKRYPFMGVAVLGAVWQSDDPLEMVRKFRKFADL